MNLSDRVLKELYEKVKKENPDMSLDELLQEAFKTVKTSDIDSFEDFRALILKANNINEYDFYTKNVNPELKKYIESRTDENPALFVSRLKPFNRLNISGVEILLRKLGKSLGIPKVHPHKFRRTLATRAIDKGMPIEQVQRLLGHAKIDTTMQYAMVNQQNVKMSHQKFIA